MTHKPIRVLIADDHLIVRMGLRYSLAGAPDLEVVGEAEHGEEALYLCRKLMPDIVLIDVHMAGMGGLAATRGIRSYYPNITVIAISMSESSTVVRDMIDAGASGYLTKAIAPHDLVSAIRRVHRGETVIVTSPDAVEPESPGAGSAGSGAILALPPQQRRVLALLAEGYSSREIAEHINISVRTVRYHVGEILTRLGAANRVEAAAIAVREGLVKVKKG